MIWNVVIGIFGAALITFFALKAVVILDKWRARRTYPSPIPHSPPGADLKAAGIGGGAKPTLFERSALGIDVRTLCGVIDLEDEDSPILEYITASAADHEILSAMAGDLFFLVGQPHVHDKAK